MEQAAEAAKKHLNNVHYFRGDEELKYEVFNAFPRGISEDGLARIAATHIDNSSPFVLPDIR